MSKRVSHIKKSSYSKKRRNQEQSVHLSKKKKSTLKKKSERRPEKRRGLKKKQWRFKIKRTLKEFLIALALLGVVLYVVSLFTFSFVKIEGYSMMPTVNDGEWTFVNKLANIKRFKMVLYKEPKSNEYSVRRVIGLPGERIRYKDDKLYVNDIDMYERFLYEQLDRAKSSQTVFTEDWGDGTVTIPEGEYLLLGDNRPYAIDGRDYGYVSKHEIIGVVEMRLFPVHKIQQF
ncbi:signal peptidase I [Enterococcus ureasiticus]|uniref:Signal peptidase I n=1 Tax=Enterococcus ureasiticus TaxID=903984 RepID=A0A1E5GAI1_9ENTE|nr:signal peptidase I [Enterococcus ureasiticus]OEG09718.1 signal peptidase I [Enterococcus ureasiticus]